MSRGSHDADPGAVRRFRTAVEELFMRMAASGIVSPRFFLRSVPDPADLPGRTGDLSVEIVSHCWNYHFLLAYQLSSLVNHPPSRSSVTMTVFYSTEDRATSEMLAFFGAMRVERVNWNWVAIEKERLFRRSIGRNQAARASRADWVWFTDCDVVFHEGAIDSLTEALQGRRDRLVFPRVESTTPLLDDRDPLLTAAFEHPALVEIDTTLFTSRPLDVAKGPMQITHGDVARSVGYCESPSVYQRPSDHWRKAWEDRAFRWLLRTEGTPVDVESVYRIRHAAKGRYREKTVGSRTRGTIRRLESALLERWLDRGKRDDRGEELK